MRGFAGIICQIIIILLFSTLAALLVAALSFIWVARRFCPPIGDEMRPAPKAEGELMQEAIANLTSIFVYLGEEPIMADPDNGGVYRGKGLV